uniref:Uncharacterized protein n=1 Tax=Brassica campestris TaxID=3711 RepID=M4E7W7_BRACM
MVRWRLAGESSSGVTRVGWRVPAAHRRARGQVEADGTRVVPEEEVLITCWASLMRACLSRPGFLLVVWGVGPCSCE